MTRTERIDAAVSDAGQLITALLEKGPLNPAQCSVLVLAAARAVVENFEEWEAHDAAIRIVKQLNDENQSRNGR
jgi:hypothetical protein